MIKSLITVKLRKEKAMKIDELTWGQIKELRGAFEGLIKKDSEIAQDFIGRNVIIRTYSAGVWFGILDKKNGNEVILKNARRMYRWWAAQSISLSGVAIHGIIEDKSKICPPIPHVWLKSIEILEVSPLAERSLLGAKNVEAE